MSEILVIGHKNPDTDAIVSAIGYAEYKRRTGTINVTAARCGATNQRIDFVLREFGVPAPKLVGDVSPKVRDVMQRNVIGVPPNATISEALRTMDEKGVRVLPVVDHGHQCLGLLSVFKTSKFFFPSGNSAYSTRLVRASINSLTRALGAKLMAGSTSDTEEDLIMMIGAMTRSEFDERIPKYPRTQLLVVVGNRTSIQRSAIESGVRVLIVTGGFQPSEELITAAKDNGVAMLVSPHDSATTSILCRTAATVRNVIEEEFLSFEPGETLTSITRIAAASNFLAFPVIDEDGRMVGVFSKSDFLKKVNRKLILVDHNELSQAVKGADQVEIIEIIDHHRIGSFMSPEPILFRNEPVGSTSTIVAECFLRDNVPLPGSIAGILLAGLVTDTLNLTSPTATKRDADVLRELEKLAEVDAGSFTERVFASGSVLISSTPDNAIIADCKEYEEDGRTFSVAQIEELGFQHFHRRKDAIVAALESYREKKGYYFSSLLITDVVRQTSLLILTGDDEFIDTVHHPKVEPGIFELANVVSRKKQLLPYLTNCLKSVLQNQA